jgi:hypothetical protein
MDRSVTRSNSAVAQVRELWEPAEKGRDAARFLQIWHDMPMKDPDDVPSSERPTLPRKAPEDIRKVAETALTPNAKGLVDQFSQQVRIEGIRLENSGKNAPAWALFERNGMGGKQVPLWKAQFLHGQAFGIALPAIGRLDGAKTAALQLRSAQRMTAFYRDDFDEFPEFAIDVDTVTDNEGRDDYLISFYDDTHIHRMTCPADEPDKLSYIDNEPHNMGITPIQRFGLLNLDGEAPGEVAPYLSLLRRIDQDTADRLVLQRFLSWVVRTATGIDKPTSPEEEEALEYMLGVGDILSAVSPAAKFSTLQGQPMDGHISAREADMRDLASTSQVPAYRMLGLSDNIGAEAIAAADASLKRKMDEYKAVLGEQFEAFMRLGGHAAGDKTISGDFSSRTQWAVTESIDIQSLAQAIHQLNADDRGIPFEMLWKWIPQWTQNDTVEAMRLREILLREKQEREIVEAAMKGGGAGGNNPGNPAGGPTSGGSGAAG